MIYFHCWIFFNFMCNAVEFLTLCVSLFPPKESFITEKIFAVTFRNVYVTNTTITLFTVRKMQNPQLLASNFTFCTIFKSGQFPRRP